MKTVTHALLGFALAFGVAGAALAADEVNVAPGG